MSFGWYNNVRHFYEDYGPDDVEDAEWGRFWEGVVFDCERAGLDFSATPVDPLTLRPTQEGMATLGAEMTAYCRRDYDKHPEIKVSYDTEDDALVATIDNKGSPRSTTLENEWVWQREPTSESQP